MSRRNLLLIRWAVFMIACGFLWVRITRQQSKHDLWSEWLAGVDRVPLWSVMAVFLLMLVNWGIEAWKWRWLMNHVERMTFLRAFKATIAGTSIGIITPNRVGEFAGRVLFLAPENRWRGGFATALGSIAQFVVTLMAGGAALGLQRVSALNADGVNEFETVGSLALIALVAGGAVVLFFSPQLLRQLFLMVPFLKRWESASAILEGYRRPELIRVMGLSVMRYAVFTFQFMLVLSVVADVPLAGSMLVVPIIYLLTTLVPTMMLTELGVRGSVAVALFDQMGSPGAVLLASFLVWLINIATPALAGSLILLFARIRSARDTQ